MAHIITEAEKSQYLLSGSWKPKKSDGGVVRASGPTVQGPVLGTLLGSQAEREKKKKFSLPPSFCSVSVLSGRDGAHPHCGEEICFTQSTDFKDRLYPKTPSQTHPERMFSPTSGHLVIQSS